MSLIFNEALIGAAGQGGAYQIEQSLRFDGSSAYLSRTPSSDTSTNKKGTFSVWIKSLPGSGTNGGTFIGAADSYYYGQFFNERFYFGNDTSYLDVAGQRRDPSAWYHVVYVFDTTLATANDRTKIYVNGTRQTDIGTYNTQPSQNSSFKFLNTAQAYNLGRRPSGSNVYFNGYFAELHFVDGQALDSEDFGEYDQSGVWRPIKYTGSHGTNGFYLKFDPSATNGIGHDHSGNGNNWTPSGFTTSGTGTDVMSDTPTNNWCTLNPLNTGAAYTLSNGNLELTSTANWDGTTGTFVVSSGKWYYEFTRGSGTSGLLGWCEPQNYDITTEPGDPANSSVWRYRDDGTKRNGEAGGQSYGATWTTAGDVIGCALDLDAGTIAFYKNGTSQGTAYSNLSGKTLVPVIGFYNCTAASSVNFGQRAFAYTPPTGFKALNTSNLPEPDIADGSQYFNTVLYTGDGTSSRAITGMGFKADFLWLKPRSTRNHSLVDVLRGTNHLKSNQTDLETSVPSFDSFDSDGFTVTSDGSTNPNWNESPEPNVVWGWLAGGSGSSIATGSIDGTNPTIASTVSANPTAGFSIVTYSGNNSSSATVGHGLGVTPDLVMVKNRSTSGYVWMVKWGVLNGDILELPGTRSKSATSSYSTGTVGTLTSTTFGFATGSGLAAVNGTGQNYLAYCFASIDGYSKFGSYEGNGNSNGPFVYCGFKPAMVFYKNADASSDWTIVDSARSPYNEVDIILDPNNNTAEGSFGTTNRNIDFLSNGFKIRSTAAGGTTALNASGNTIVFAAFASNPFGGDGVTPATAR